MKYAEELLKIAKYIKSSGNYGLPEKPFVKKFADYHEISGYAHQIKAKNFKEVAYDGKYWGLFWQGQKPSTQTIQALLKKAGFVPVEGKTDFFASFKTAGEVTLNTNKQLIFIAKSLKAFDDNFIVEMLDYEDGRLPKEKIPTFFQKMIDTGLINKVRHTFGPMANKLIEQGLCHPKGVMASIPKKD